VTSARRPSNSTIPTEFSKVGPVQKRHRTGGLRTPASAASAPSTAPAAPVPVSLIMRRCVGESGLRNGEHTI